MSLKSPTVCMQTSEVDLLKNTITRTFYNDPRAKYIIPDARTRRAVLSWFASAIIPACRTWGELYAIVKAEAGALWIRPGIEWTIGRALKMKLIRPPRTTILKSANLPLVSPLGVSPKRNPKQIGRIFVTGAVTKLTGSNATRTQAV